MSEFLIYKTEDERVEIDVILEDETVWLSQMQMARLFDTTKQNISLHINNCFEEGELSEEATVKEYLTVQNEGIRSVSRNVKHYNLDVIISVGYRVKSLRGTQFRQWATKRLNEYIKKGFQGAGNISHEKAIEKAHNEYKKYQARTLSHAEQDYLDTIRLIGKKEKS